MSDLNEWNTAAANNNDAPPDGWPENTMQYSEVNDAGREVMAALARFHKDINGSLTTAGAANAYTITLNQSYSAYYTGLYFVAKFHAANTGATTVNVNTIGDVSVVDRAGNALTSGEIQTNGIYELRHDGVQFQLMGSIVGAVSTTTGTFSNSDAPDLVDTNVALNVGASAPAAAQHIEVGPAQIQSKSDGTTAAAISINALGGGVNVGPQSGTGTVALYEAGAIAARTSSLGFDVLSTINDDPRLNFYQDDGATQNGYVEFDASSGVRIQNLVHGSPLTFSAEDTGGTDRTIVTGDPDGDLNFYYAGALRAGARSAGTFAVYGDSNSDAATRLIRFRWANGAEKASIGNIGDEHFRVRSLINSSRVILESRDSLGNATILVDGDPDGAVVTNYDGLRRTATLVGGRLGLYSDGNSDFENRYIAFLYQDGTQRGRVGHFTDGTLTIRNELHGHSVSIEAEDTGGTPRLIVRGDPDNSTWSYYNGTLRTATQNSGIFGIYSDASTDTEGRYLSFLHQDGTPRGRVGYVADGVLRVRNEIHGGNVILESEDAGGTLQTLVQGDPDGRVFQYDAGTIRTATAPSGTFVIHSDGNTDAETRRLSFRHQNGTVRGYLGHDGTSLTLHNSIHSGQVLINGEDSGGTTRSILHGDPDGRTTAYHNGTLAFRSATQGNGGLEAYNGATGDGSAERVLTEIDGAQLATAQATTSGSTITFSSIKSNAKKITLMLEDVSVSTGTSLLVQIGDSGGLETSGYTAYLGILDPGLSPTLVATAAAFTVGYLATAADEISGAVVLTLLDDSTNTWTIHGNSLSNDAVLLGVASGVKSLTGVLDRVALTVGSGTFDNGKVNILVEG